MIQSLLNRDEYRRRVRKCWEENITYWLSSDLRHVTDVGDYIVDYIIKSCSTIENPTIIDMGFGSAWIYLALRKRNYLCKYIGLDSCEKFVSYAQNKFSSDDLCRFELIDLEEPIKLDVKGDFVINAFNLFELSDIQQPIKNAYDLLSQNGHFLISTIDSTYLILAVSSSWSEFLHNLDLYQNISGIKYAFQPIDLGDKASKTLEYPSVLYSREDYITAAKNVGFQIASYKEHVFTSKPIPKIYFHIDFVKGGTCV